MSRPAFRLFCSIRVFQGIWNGEGGSRGRAGLAGWRSLPRCGGPADRVSGLPCAPLFRCRVALVCCWFRYRRFKCHISVHTQLAEAAAHRKVCDLLEITVDQSGPVSGRGSSVASLVSQTPERERREKAQRWEEGRAHARLVELPFLHLNGRCPSFAIAPEPQRQRCLRR